MKRKIFSVLFALMLVLSMSLVTAVPVAANGDPVENIDTAETFATIQAAINDAETVDGHTILVDNTYDSSLEATWPIDVDKAVTIESVYGADVTTIDPGAAGQGAIAITADGVTIDGFTIKPGTEGYDADHPMEHTVWVGAEYSTIINNTIYGDTCNRAGLYIGDRNDPGTESPAIYSYDVSTPLGHTIQYNTFLMAASGEGWGIFAYDLSDSVISHNYFIGDAGDVGHWAENEGAPGTCIQIHKATVATGDPSPGEGDVLIEHNVARYVKYSWLTFSAHYSYIDSVGVAYEQPEDSTVDGVIISNNTIRDVHKEADSHSTAVKFQGFDKSDCYGVKGADLTVGSNWVIIGGNNFFDNDIGVMVDEPTNYDAEYACVLGADNIIIDDNNISSNTACGVYNGTDDPDQEGGAMTIDAEYNWWGSASGPAYANLNGPLVIPGNTFNVGNQGNIVTDCVDYVPWLDGEYPVGSSFAPVETTGPASLYSSILAAINAATDGDTITCAAGTFTEDVNPVGTHIETPNLTLQSESGRDLTTIQLVDGVGIDLGGGADNFVLGGSSGHGFNIVSSDGGSTTFNIQLANAPSDVTISYNIIDTTGTASHGISIGAAGASGLTVSNNTFDAEDGDGSIWGPDVADVTVLDNTFNGPVSPTSGYAVELSGVDGATISGNTIDGYGMGVFVFGAAPGCGTEAVSDVTISGNTITNCTKAVRLGHSSQTATMEDVTVSGNTLYNNTTGVYVADSPYTDTSNFLIDGNTISHNVGDSSKGIWFEGGEGGTISDNCIMGNNYGIYLAEPVSWVEIYENCIVGNYDGIWVAGCHNTIGAQGQGNVISCNRALTSGVHFTATALYNLINYNDICFNSSVAYGVFNENSVSVDATHNWWGDAGGPSGEGPGTWGDAVSDNVFYDPWETSPVADTTVPTITYTGASPEMVSLWNDDMFYGAANPDGGMWGLMDYGYSVGPSCETIISVVASDDCCLEGNSSCSSVAWVSLDAKQLLLDLIPEEKLQKFIDREFAGNWDSFWAGIVGVMDGFMVNHDLYDMEYYPLIRYYDDVDGYTGCWFSGRNPGGDGAYHVSSIACLLDSTFTVLELSDVEMAEIMGQELMLGDKEIEVTAWDYSGNASIPATVDLTVVDFQMPVCEGWNLRSTWLALEDNTWEGILATMQQQDGEGSLIRWNSQYQRWEGYDETAGAGWYYSGSRIADALMEPLDAYWIYSPYNDQFGLITDRGAPTAPPSRQMYAGWSLIGADIPWELGDESADTIFKSIEEATGHCTGYTQVLSIDQYNWWDEEFYICGTYPYPYYGCELSEPGFYEKWFEQDTWVYVTGESYDGQDMTRGGGYWVFMANPSVLGGFNSAPLPVDFWMVWAGHCTNFWLLP